MMFCSYVELLEGILSGHPFNRSLPCLNMFELVRALPPGSTWSYQMVIGCVLVGDFNGSFGVHQGYQGFDA